MDHRSSQRPDRLQQVQRPAVYQQSINEPLPSHDGSYQRRTKWPIHIAVAVAVLLLAAIVWWHVGLHGQNSPAPDRYQAVFLNNGQVFFGKLKNTHGEYLVLEGAYYTKKADVPEDATPEQKAAVEANVSLAKVGNEVYGPESTMSIRAEQVLFWQNLTTDSKVTKAIKDADDN